MARVVIKLDGELSIDGKANALLISKAPEMLEMLKKLVNEFSHYTELAQGTSKCGAVLDVKQLIKESTKNKTLWKTN